MATSLRLRLAVWYAGLLALILVSTATVSYSFHSVLHYDEVDRALASTAVHIRAQVESTGAAGIRADGVLPIPSFEEHTSPEIYVRLYDHAGRLVASSRNATDRPEFDPRAVASSPRDTESNFFADNLVR